MRASTNHHHSGMRHVWTRGWKVSMPRVPGHLLQPGVCQGYVGRVALLPFTTCTAHKQASGCKGKRPRAEFVPVKEFDEHQLMAGASQHDTRSRTPLSPRQTIAFSKTRPLHMTLHAVYAALAPPVTLPAHCSFPSTCTCCSEARCPETSTCNSCTQARAGDCVYEKCTPICHHQACHGEKPTEHGGATRPRASCGLWSGSSQTA